MTIVGKLGLYPIRLIFGKIDFIRGLKERTVLFNLMALKVMLTLSNLRCTTIAFFCFWILTMVNAMKTVLDSQTLQIHKIGVF